MKIIQVHAIISSKVHDFPLDPQEPEANVFEMDLVERIQEISIHEENIQEITIIKTQSFQVPTEMEEEKLKR